MAGILLFTGCLVTKVANPSLGPFSTCSERQFAGCSEGPFYLRQMDREFSENS